MKFILNALIINFKLIIRKIFVLFSFFISMIALCFILQAIITEIYKNEEIKLKVSIVNEDTYENTDKLIDLALKNSAVTDLITAELENYEVAREKLKNSEIIAILIIPEDFLTSVFKGQNKSINIEMSTTNLLDKYIISNVANELSNILLHTQSGVATTFQIMMENYINTNNYVIDVNLDYVNTLLKYDTLFKENELLYVKTLDIITHYVFCFAIFILFLTTPLFYNEMNINQSIPILKNIKGSTKNYSFFYFAKLIILISIYFFIFLILNIMFDAEIDSIYLLKLFNSAVFLILIQALFFNITKDYIGAVFLNFIMHILFLIISGGIIPTLFLPQFIAKIEFLSPVSIIKTVFSQGIINIQTNIDIFILIFNIGVILILLFKIEKNTKVGIK